MRWKGETYEQEQARLREWHSPFAWIPVQMDDGKWVWLERYKRRLIKEKRGYGLSITCEWERLCAGPSPEPKQTKSKWRPRASGWRRL